MTSIQKPDSARVQTITSIRPSIPVLEAGASEKRTRSFSLNSFPLFITVANMAEFDLPTDEFEKIESLIRDGNTDGAVTRFQEITQVGAEDAVFYVEQIASGVADAEIVEIDAPADTQPPPSIIPLPTISPREETVEPAPSDDWIVRGNIDKSGVKKRAGSDNDGELRWYERILPWFLLPLFLGGMIGGAFFGMGFWAIRRITSSTSFSRPKAFGLSLLMLIGTFVGYGVFAVVLFGGIPFFRSDDSSDEKSTNGSRRGTESGEQLQVLAVVRAPASQ